LLTQAYQPPILVKTNRASSFTLLVYRLFDYLRINDSVLDGTTDFEVSDFLKRF
jgi:hypothetical protein